MINEKFDLNSLTQEPQELIELIVEMQIILSRASDDNLDYEVVNNLLEEAGASGRVKHIVMSLVNAERLRRK